MLKTRLVMAPMATGRANEDGLVTRNLCDYYHRRAKAGGLGAIIVEHAFIHPQGRLAPNQLSIATDDCIEGLSQLVGSIHEPFGGTLAICQLTHAGSNALPADLSNGLVAPSACIHPGHKRSGNTGLVPHALTSHEIHELTDCFCEAAQRAEAAGFDGVELHAAHGYLLDQFYSPLTNHRDDEYGPQSIENRTRFLCETIQRVRESVGEIFLIAVRFGPCDYAPNGAVLEDGPQAAVLLEQAGADIIDVSGGMFNFSAHELRPPGFFRESSTAIHAAIHIPVLTAGGVHLPQEAEWLLQTGATDLVGIGRLLMRQPDWAAKAISSLCQVGVL
ncbi:MAG: NADH:flavin oxidoreductase [Coriobacteriales bacterium]|nr:NADH:flavin oxidoreductase [Coriobacteriales bacterium]